MCHSKRARRVQQLARRNKRSQGCIVCKLAEGEREAQTGVLPGENPTFGAQSERLFEASRAQVAGPEWGLGGASPPKARELSGPVRLGPGVGLQSPFSSTSKSSLPTFPTKLGGLIQ